jgi:CheY-like chemotaxis protein
VEGERRYYQEMLAGLPVPLAILGYDRYFVYANRAFRTTFHVSGDDIRRKSVSQILPGRDLEEALEAAQTQRSIEPVLLSDGDRVVRVSLLSLRQWDENADDEMVLVAEDLTDIAHVGPLSTAPPSDLGAVVWEADPVTLEFKKVRGDTQRLTGQTPQQWLETANFFEQRIHSEDRAGTLALYAAAIAKGGEASAEFRTLSASGGIVWCRETIQIGPPGTADRMLRGVVTDFTGRKHLEQQLLTGARNEALRELSGRLIHSLNNSLMIVSGHQEELLTATPETSPVRADIVEMATATKRIADVASRLSEFVKPVAQPAEPVDLGKLLNAIGAELVRVAGAGTTVETSSAGNAIALAHPEQLTGVIMALAAGVREGALERTKLSLSSSSHKQLERVAGALAPGKYARVQIRDNGRGLDAKRRAAIFESIVPEKERTSAWAVQRAYAIVREWGGDIAVESEMGQGTTFTILLPHAPEAEPAEVPVTEQNVTRPIADEPAGTPATTLPIPPPPDQFRETILVVDDEAGIRGLVRKILRRERYQVLEAGSAEEALRIVRSHNGAIDLLVTDVMMPGMKGTELARQMAESLPKLKVLYISGFAAEESAGSTSFPPGAQFLAKPFTLGALVASVRSTLDA